MDQRLEVIEARGGFLLLAFLAWAIWGIYKAIRKGDTSDLKKVGLIVLIIGAPGGVFAAIKLLLGPVLN